MSSYTYGKLTFRIQVSLKGEISCWNLRFIFKGDKIVILMSQGLHTEKWITDPVIANFSFENCSFHISILYDIPSLIPSSVVKRSSSVILPCIPKRHACGYSWLFPVITAIFSFLIKQQLSALVVGCLPLNVDEAGQYLHDTEKYPFQNRCCLSKGLYTTLREKK